MTAIGDSEIAYRGFSLVLQCRLKEYLYDTERETTMKKSIISLSAILSLTTLCSLFSVPIYAESRKFTPVTEKNLVVTAASKVDADTSWAILSFIIDCYRAVHANDALIGPEYSYYLNNGMTVCDYLNRFYSSDEFVSYARRLNNRSYVELIHLTVLGRHASDRETKIGMNYLKKHDRMEYVAMILKQPGTWIEFIDSNSHLSFGNPYDDYVWNR